MSAGQPDVVETGVEVIDRKLGGGIPRGAVVALSATAASQSELFLYEFVETRETVYLSTVRTPETIETTLAERGVDRGGVEVVRTDPAAPLDHARGVIDDLPAETNLVVDPVSVLEATGDGYREFVADLRRRTSEGGNVALFHCLRDGTTPDHRRETLHVADLVFDLSTELDGQSVVNRLTVPKFRSGQSVDEVLKLDLTSEVEVDRSRNIV